MRRCPAHRAPWVGQFSHLFHSGARGQAEAQSDSLLDGKVARRPGVPVAKAEQEVDVGRPGADTMQRRQSCMRQIGRLVGERVEIEALAREFPRQCFQRFDLSCRQAKATQPLGASGADRLMIQWIKGRVEPSPDRRGAGRG